MPKLDRLKFFEKIGYVPHEKQYLYHGSKARFRVPVCGRRFGKSTMAGRDLEPELFLPNRMYWIVGPTYDLGEKEFRVIWDDLIIRQGFGKDKRVKKAYNKKQGNMFIEMPWRTRVEVRSADHPDRLVGEGLDGVIMSEAAKQREDTWEKFIRPALADKHGWATFPTTPEGQNWLYKLWQLGRNPNEPDYESWRFPSWDNLAVYPGGIDDPEIQLLRRTTTPEWFEQEIAADFTAFVGKVYGEFVEDTHVTSIQYNPAWKNYIFFDWGFVNPLAAIEVMVDPQDNVYIWREHYKSFLTLHEHLEIMRKREQPDDYHVDMCFGDAADPEATRTVSQYGPAPCMSLPEAKENWREGVQLVKTFLKKYETGLTDEYGAPFEKPKLYVDHSCVNVIREFNNYRSPESRGDKNAREAAQPFDDHALDAIRYGLMHLFKLGAGSHLSDVLVSTEATSSLASPVGNEPRRDSTGDEAGFFTSGMEF